MAAEPEVPAKMNLHKVGLSELPTTRQARSRTIIGMNKDNTVNPAPYDNCSPLTPPYKTIARFPM